MGPKLALTVDDLAAILKDPSPQTPPQSGLSQRCQSEYDPFPYLFFPPPWGISELFIKHSVLLQVISCLLISMCQVSHDIYRKTHTTDPLEQ